MRRLWIALLALAASACATPPIRLSPAYPTGHIRTYILSADATTQIEIAGQRRNERRRLEARSTVEVIGTKGDEATVRLRLTPTRLRIGERDATVPQPQEAEVVLGPDGGLARIETIGGLPPEVSAGGLEELLPLLGAPLPTKRVRVGERWHRAVPGPEEGMTGRQDGRVDGLKVVDGFDTASVILGTRRPLVRERSVDGEPVRLTGTEYSNSVLAYAFREGFAVAIETDSEGRFDLAAGSFTGGSVTIRARTVLRLVSRSG